MYMTPSAEVNDIIIGCIGRAQMVYPVGLHGFVFMSNHYHMLISVRDAEQCADFLRHLNSNIARELNRLLKQHGAFWHCRFHGIRVDDTEQDQMDRLRYMLSHGVKEGLVRGVREWPGASSVPWLLDGEPIRGTWHDRTAAWDAGRRKNFKPIPGQFEIVYELHLTPLPCWAHLPDHVWRRYVRRMVEEIETEAASTLRQAGILPLGVAGVWATDPHFRPAHSKWSPAPLIHSRDPERHRQWRAFLLRLLADYAAASEAFRAGDRTVNFPAGTFTPCGFSPWHAQLESPPKNQPCREPQLPAPRRDWPALAA